MYTTCILLHVYCMYIWQLQWTHVVKDLFPESDWVISPTHSMCMDTSIIDYMYIHVYIYIVYTIIDYMYTCIYMCGRHPAIHNVDYMYMYVCTFFK